METQTLEQSFSTYFNAKPKFIVHALGHASLIGEYADYNDGFFPANGTIDRTESSINMGQFSTHHIGTMLKQKMDTQNVSIFCFRNLEVKCLLFVQEFFATKITKGH